MEPKRAQLYQPRPVPPKASGIPRDIKLIVFATRPTFVLMIQNAVIMLIKKIGATKRCLDPIANTHNNPADTSLQFEVVGLAMAVKAINNPLIRKNCPPAIAAW